MMDFNCFDSHQMKENVDINLLHLTKTNKQAHQKHEKLTKRELFKESNNNNSTKIIKKTAYIIDSEEELSPQKSEHKVCKSHRSIDEVSEIIESVSRDTSFQASPKQAHSKPISTCSSHQDEQIYSYNYCMQCSLYLLCSQCIKSQHSKHMILSFSTETEAKCLTKQFLIEKIEQTLQKLKSKENDLKNKSSEMELIAVKVKKMEDEVMDKLQKTFTEIGNRVRTFYEKQQTIYEEQIDSFYREYNKVGEQLRENLLSIIDESFEIKTFESSLICKQPPAVPNQQINRFKSTLQKTKKFYKSIIESLDELKQKTEQFSKQSVKNVNKQSSVFPNKKASISKYEKFLSESCFNDNGQETKSSLVRILETITR